MLEAILILDKLNKAEHWEDYYPSKVACNSAIQELKELEGKSCRNCKYCPEDCDDDGEWYCEHRDKSIELDFSCEEWIAE
mgnify:CR=1 FL=1